MLLHKDRSVLDHEDVKKQGCSPCAFRHYRKCKLLQFQKITEYMFLEYLKQLQLFNVSTFYYFKVKESFQLSCQFCYNQNIVFYF